MRIRLNSQRVASRRDALRAGVVGAGISLCRSLSHDLLAEDLPSGDWIDAHVHVWTPDVDHFPLAAGFTRADMQPASFTPEQLWAHARPCGVRRIVLIQMSYYGFDNSYMLSVMRNHPGVFSGVAIVDENNDPASRMKQLAAQGVRGFRIQPAGRTPDAWLAGDGMQAMWRCGAEEGLAMCHLIHPEFLPSVDRMCRKFPDTPVVIDHFARIGIDGVIRPRDLDSLCQLSSHKNVSVKVSAYYALGKKKPPYLDLSPMIRRVLDAFGPERLMWASDCPFQVQGPHTYEASIDLLRTDLRFLTADDREWLLRKAAARVFFM